MADKNLWLSTGVLTREPATVTAVANIVNLSCNSFYYISLEVWDWSSYDQPFMLPVIIGDNTIVTEPVKLEPQHLAVLYSDLGASNTELYEMRIRIPDNDFILVNCFGRSAFPYTSQEGNTVLHSELIHLKY